MKPHLEIEYKTLLSKNEYQKLDTYFNFDETVTQTNIYYDANDILLNLKMMCRIRVIENKYEFTLKVPQSEGVLEYEFEMESINLNHPKLIEILSPYITDFTDFKEIARSTTLRKISRDQFGEWCLDYSEFTNNSDYELEYELTEPNDQAYPHYISMIESLDIQYKEAMPKYLRALQSRKESTI